MQKFYHVCSMDIEEVKQLRLITAIKTPYLPDGRFDLEAFDDLVRQQVEHGVEGVIIGGTTGEGQLMNWEEHIMLIAHTVHYFGTEIKVLGKALPGHHYDDPFVLTRIQGFCQYLL